MVTCIYLLTGQKFWKVGSRKIFAVQEKTGIKMKGKKRKRWSDSDSEYESDSLASKLDMILFKVDRIMDVTPQLQLPLSLGLLTIIKETFKCHICLSSPLSPPAMFGRCCRQIIGCKSCTDQWYSGEEGITKQCPLCRCDRGFADSCAILGLDEFLSALANVINSSPQEAQAVPAPPIQFPDIVE